MFTPIRLPLTRQLLPTLRKCLKLCEGVWVFTITAAGLEWLEPRIVPGLFVPKMPVMMVEKCLQLPGIPGKEVPL